MIISHHNYDLTNATTFAIPAKCRLFVEYDNKEDIPVIIDKSSPGNGLVHIGGGSNILFTSDFDGTVAHSAIKSMDILHDDPSHILIQVGAGIIMDDFIQWACDNGYWGVENLSGIPGEVGASAVQNVGAYGVEASDAIVEVNAFDSIENKFVTQSRDECQYGYRDSIFKNARFKGRYIIWSVVYTLSKVPTPNISYPALTKYFREMPKTPNGIRNAVIEIRNTKLPDPSITPSAGSFFKNPVISDTQYRHIISIVGSEEFPHYKVDGGWKIPAAWLIDQCGWKGYEDGNVAVWHLQPLVIVNPHRKASASEVLALEKKIQNSVSDKYGIELIPEVEHIGKLMC